MRKQTGILALASALSACGGIGEQETVLQEGPAQGRGCAVGSTCENLGGDRYYEGKRLNQGDKADSNEALEAEASRIRNASPEELQETIEKLEKGER